MGSRIVPALLGRSSDYDRLVAVTARLHAGAGAALVLSGEAGMGKTRLLQEMVRDAVNVRTYSVSGYESETHLGFAGLHRLLRSLLGDIAALPALQRDALATALGLSTGPPPSRFLLGVATTALLERATRDGALLCVVDDAQWLDEETLDVLAFAARRLDASAVGLVFGIRAGEPASARLRGIPEHRVGPLPEQDMRSLLLAAAPTPPAPHVAGRLLAESGGNPLALLEYVASLSADLLAGSAPLPPALPVGKRLTSGFAAQIARLPDGTRQMLLVLSAAGIDDADAVPEACRRLGLSPDASLPALRASILSARPRLVFRHPLIRSVVYDGSDLPARRRVHGVLAQVSHDHGFPDCAAWHRAHGTVAPDDDVARQLEGAAARARDRGGYAAEARFLTLSSRHTETGTREHTRRLLAAAHAHITAGDGAQAQALLDGWSPTGWTRALVAAARVSATIAVNEARTGLEASLLATAADQLPEEEYELCWQLRCGAFLVALETDDCTVNTTLYDLARTLLEQPISATREAVPADMFFEGLATRRVSGYAAGAPLLRDALLDVGQTASATQPSIALLTWMVTEDLWRDDYQSTTWAATTRHNQIHGAWAATWIGLGTSAIVEARHGHFDSAQRLFDETAAVGDAMGVNEELLWGTKIEFRAWQGQEAQTRSMADRLINFWADGQRYGCMRSYALLALTLLELSLGHYAPALAHAMRLADDDPPGHGSRILPDLIEAAGRTGHGTEVRQALDELTVRATTAGTPWALGALARSRALSLGPSLEAETHYRNALHRLNQTSLRTEIARTHLVYGEWLRRRKRRADAREQLGAAHAAFSDMGAVLFAQRAGRELAATGAPAVTPAPEPRTSLTPQERRVAELAARGMTNHEISEELFISGSTVDYHLSKILRKLQINSRRRIRAVLDER